MGGGERKSECVDCKCFVKHLMIHLLNSPECDLPLALEKGSHKAHQGRMSERPFSLFTSSTAHFGIITVACSSITETHSEREIYLINSSSHLEI
jgi:hypothetical protein